MAERTGKTAAGSAPSAASAEAASAPPPATTPGAAAARSSGVAGHAAEPYDMAYLPRPFEPSSSPTFAADSPAPRAAVEEVATAAPDVSATSACNVQSHAHVEVLQQQVPSSKNQNALATSSFSSPESTSPLHRPCPSSTFCASSISSSALSSPSAYSSSPSCSSSPSRPIPSQPCACVSSAETAELPASTVAASSPRAAVRVAAASRGDARVTSGPDHSSSAAEREAAAARAATASDELLTVVAAVDQAASTAAAAVTPATASASADSGAPQACPAEADAAAAAGEAGAVTCYVKQETTAARATYEAPRTFSSNTNEDGAAAATAGVLRSPDGEEPAPAETAETLAAAATAAETTASAAPPAALMSLSAGGTPTSEDEIARRLAAAADSVGAAGQVEEVSTAPAAAEAAIAVPAVSAAPVDNMLAAAAHVPSAAAEAPLEALGRTDAAERRAADNAVGTAGACQQQQAADFAASSAGAYAGATDGARSTFLVEHGETRRHGDAAEGVDSPTVAAAATTVDGFSLTASAAATEGGEKLAVRIDLRLLGTVVAPRLGRRHREKNTSFKNDEDAEAVDTAAGIESEQRANKNCVRGVCWSVDGSAFLTWSDDAVVELFANVEEGCPSDVEASDGGGAAHPADNAAAALCAAPAAGREQRTTSRKKRVVQRSAGEVSLPADYHTGVQELLPWTAVSEGGECVFDCCWYPRLHWSSPRSFSFAVTSRDLPIHLYSGIDCGLLGTYACYNRLEEVTHAFSIAFHPQQPLLLAGGVSAVHLFDVERPGRQRVELPLAASRRDREHQKGVISSIDFKTRGNGAYSLFACGSFSGSVCTYTAEWTAQSDRTLRHALAQYLRDDYTLWGGVTQVKFVGEHLLVSGHRQDGLLRCWDLRQPHAPLWRLQRGTASISQRVSFDVVESAVAATAGKAPGQAASASNLEATGSLLATGNDSGDLFFYSLRWGRLVGKCTCNPAAPSAAAAADGWAATAAGEERDPAAGYGDAKGSASAAVVAVAFHPSQPHVLTAFSNKWWTPPFAAAGADLLACSRLQRQQERRRVSHVKELQPAVSFLGKHPHPPRGRNNGASGSSCDNTDTNNNSSSTSSSTSSSSSSSQRNRSNSRCTSDGNKCSDSNSSSKRPREDALRRLTENVHRASVWNWGLKSSTSSASAVSFSSQREQEGV